MDKEAEKRIREAQERKPASSRDTDFVNRVNEAVKRNQEHEKK